MATNELYDGTRFTLGWLNPRDTRADLAVHVTGLPGADREQLHNAIISAYTGRTVHPDDATLPLRYATGYWYKGGDSGSTDAEAIVLLTYDKRGSGEATDATEFSNVANVNVRYEPIQWWGDKLSEPANTGPGNAAAITEKSDPRAGNPEVLIPHLKTFYVPIWDIEVPTVLASSPISSVAATTGKVNDPAVTLSGKSFAAGTLRFNGVNQRVTKIDDGASVTYEFFVSYSFSYREDQWCYSYLVNDGGEYKAAKDLMYESDAFPTFPV